jgi:hypothetical protein
VGIARSCFPSRDFDNIVLKEIQSHSLSLSFLFSVGWAFHLA